MDVRWCVDAIWHLPFEKILLRIQVARLSLSLSIFCADLTDSPYNCRTSSEQPFGLVCEPYFR